MRRTNAWAMGLLLGVVAVLPGCGGRGADPASPVATAPAATTTVFKVSGMHCTGCEQSIKSEVAKLAGVTTVEADHAKGTAKVTYDPAQAKPEAIVAAIGRAGYQAKAE